MTPLQADGSEQILIKGCIENDRLIQKRLYDRYKRAMYTICYRMLGNEDDAHDALQEGFINVFKYISSYSGKGTLGSWIKTIIVRSAIKQLKINTAKNTIGIDALESFDVIEWPVNI
nr:sigma-70 family RNA polymerase sigma factor [Bacteroidota bacterium]